MTASSSTTFYKNLPAVPAGEGLCDMSLHRDVPEDWCVVIVDIVSSTQAIENGKYKEVNTIAASSITAVLNAAGREDIAYIFGGDGATLLVPASLVFDVAAALYGTRQMAEESFGLAMRAGIVFVEELRKAGAPVRVAKTEISRGVYQAALSGEGVTLAEKMVKDKDKGQQHDITTLFAPKVLASKPPSFAGLNCRWQPLVSRNGMDISLIVLARETDEAAKGKLYQEILNSIAGICGENDSWKPVDESQLTLSSSPQVLEKEARVVTSGKGGGAKLSYLAKIWALNWVGKTCLAFGLKAGDFDGKTYKKALAQNTDYMKFDNALRLIMDLSAEKKAALVEYLEAARVRGRIFYGMHAAPSALMTCIVFDLASHHFHFVDGANGGYALAAKQLKQQLKDAAQGKAA